MTKEKATKKYEELMREYNSIDDHDNEFDARLVKEIHEYYVFMKTGNWPEDEPTEFDEVTICYRLGL